MKNSIRQKCQAIWLKAYQGPIVLQYQDKSTMHRAKFALYDALRKTDDSKLAKAKEEIEIRSDSKNLTLTIQHRSLNPFYEEFENSLEASLGGFRESVADENPVESLKRFQEKMCEEERAMGSPRPATKYFSREEE